MAIEKYKMTWNEFFVKLDALPTGFELQRIERECGLSQGYLTKARKAHPGRKIQRSKMEQLRNVLVVLGVDDSAL